MEYRFKMIMFVYMYFIVHIKCEYFLLFLLEYFEKIT